MASSNHKDPRRGTAIRRWEVTFALLLALLMLAAGAIALALPRMRKRAWDIQAASNMKNLWFAIAMNAGERSSVSLLPFDQVEICEQTGAPPGIWLLPGSPPPPPEGPVTVRGKDYWAFSNCRGMEEYSPYLYFGLGMPLDELSPDAPLLATKPELLYEDGMRTRCIICFADGRAQPFEEVPQVLRDAIENHRRQLQHLQQPVRGQVSDDEVAQARLEVRDYYPRTGIYRFSATQTTNAEGILAPLNQESRALFADLLNIVVRDNLLRDHPAIAHGELTEFRFLLRDTCVSFSLRQLDLVKDLQFRYKVYCLLRHCGHLRVMHSTDPSTALTYKALDF